MTATIGHPTAAERRRAGIILAALSAVMLMPLAIWASQGRDLLTYFGFRGDIAPPLVWLAAIAFAGAYVAYTFSAVPLVRQLQSDISPLKLIGLVAAVASGIMEEVVFRRMLMDGLMANGFSTFSQVAASALIFGAAHLAWGLFSRHGGFSIGAALSTVAAGAGLAIIYILGGRSLGPCILAHFLINAVIEPWLVLAASSGKLSIGPDEDDRPHQIDDL